MQYSEVVNYEEKNSLLYVNCTAYRFCVTNTVIFILINLKYTRHYDHNTFKN